MSISKAIYDAGYAIRLYDIRTDRATWQFRNETLETKPMPTTDWPGTGVPVAPIEAVRAGVN